MSLSALSIRRPVFVLMIICALLVLGLISYGRLPVELFPSVQFPFVTVITSYPGAGPDEVESLITRPIEEQVTSLTNVRRVFSTSAEGSSIVGIEYNLGTSIDGATADVRQRVDLVKGAFPRDAEDPTVQKFDFATQPIMFFGMGGSLNGYELRQLAENVVQPRLERVPGVAAVGISGGRTREVRIEVNQDRLRALGVSVLQIADALRRENLNVPSGNLRQGQEEFLVRVVGEFKTVEEIADLRIPRFDAPPVRLGDVAAIRDTFKEPNRFTRLNGQESVGIAIQKQADANTVRVADGVRAAIAQLRPSLPPGVTIQTARDDSLFIRDSVNDVQGNLILGSLLATLVVFLFLHNIRSTVIIALALPVAIVATYIPMYFAGFSLNVLSLLGLAIAIGLMIDNAIVVNENISRHLEDEPDPKVAARKGAQEIELAVMASNLANIAVFLPIAFMKGLVGQFFRQFGLTVAFANLFSILGRVHAHPDAIQPLAPAQRTRRAGAAGARIRALGSVVRPAGRPVPRRTELGAAAPRPRAARCGGAVCGEPGAGRLAAHRQRVHACRRLRAVPGGRHHAARRLAGADGPCHSGRRAAPAAGGGGGSLLHHRGRVGHRVRLHRNRQPARADLRDARSPRSTRPLGG